LARGIDFEDDPTMSTNYVMTRWYRAPELLLNNQTVTKECDMWSVGCIMGELLGKDVLFKGTSPINQVEKILKVLGTPNMDNVKGSPQGIEFVKKLGHYDAQDFAKQFPGANPLAIDLLEQMLQFNHEKRISAEDALNHPFFADIFDNENLILHTEKFDFAFEKKLISLETVKREAYDSILEFNGLSKARTPAVQTPQERRESMKLMRDLMSPQHGGDRSSKRLQELSQRELMPVMTKAEESGKEKRAKNTPSEDPGCFPKKTIMSRVKDMFKKKDKK
jgi:serine/threonine protein kinase